VSKVGEEPAIRVDAVGVQPIVEDLRILGADFQPEHGGEAATSGQRARFFSDRSDGQIRSGESRLRD